MLQFLDPNTWKGLISMFQYEIKIIILNYVKISATGPYLGKSVAQPRIDQETATEK